MAAELDVSPASEAAGSLLTDAAAQVPGDGYGSSTIAFGTEVVKVIPPKAQRHTRIDGFGYECGATAHTVTVMVPLQKVKVATDAAAGQTSITLDVAPTDTSGAVPAANDFIVVRNEYGIYDVYKVASYSARVIVVTVSVGSADSNGVITKIEADTPVWFFGGTADHVKRQFRTPASAYTPFTPPNGICTTPNVYEPVIVHSNNATATGYMSGPWASYPKL
jgi:hypothetical protein